MRQNNKKVVGITGGSGSGKSYLCGLLKNRGYDVIDTDVIARKVMEKGEECLLETVAEFGEQILDDGNLNRKKLAKIVFSDEKKLAKLNEISHKHILKRVENMIERSVSNPVFVEGAVLIESGFDCDLMIGVLADYEVRKSPAALPECASSRNLLSAKITPCKSSFSIEYSLAQLSIVL